MGSAARNAAPLIVDVAPLLVVAVADWMVRSLFLAIDTETTSATRNAEATLAWVAV